MMRNRFPFVLSLALALSLAACDGGSRGSGITTAEGNVESLQAAETAAGVSGIRVAVEGTDVADETDAAGSFSLRGRFEGDVVIRFALPNGGAARIPVNAPAGGLLTLERVHLDADSGQASAASQSVVFEALVVGVDCDGSELELVSRHRSAVDTDVYDVRLEDSSIRDAAGSSLSCADLHAGDALDLSGSVNEDGTFGHAEMVRR